MIRLDNFPWVYGMKSGAFIKIGAADNVERRLKQFQLGNPHTMRIVLRQMCDEAYWLEGQIHRILAPYKHRREWFGVDVKTAKAAFKQATDDLAMKRRQQIAFEMESGEWDDADPHPLASWNGRGISPPHPVTNWNR